MILDSFLGSGVSLGRRASAVVWFIDFSGLVYSGYNCQMDGGPIAWTIV